MSNALTKREPAGLAIFTPEAMKAADVVSKSSLVPQSFRGKPGDVLVAWQYGHEIGMSPMQSLQSISVINGKPTVWGDALLALCLSHPDCVYIRESDFGEVAETGVAWCEVMRKGYPEPRRILFTKDQAKKARLLDKKGPWQEYPERMLLMRARGFALRDCFADALAGFLSTEEVQDYNVPERVARETKTVSKPVNKVEEPLEVDPIELINGAENLDDLSGIALQIKRMGLTGDARVEAMAAYKIRKQTLEAEEAPVFDAETGEVEEQPEFGFGGDDD